MSSPNLAALAAVLLVSFIMGVAVTAVGGWFLRERIRARMIRRRNG